MLLKLIQLRLFQVKGKLLASLDSWRSFNLPY